MNAQHTIQIGYPSPHGRAFFRYSSDWYDQRLFTDCRLVIGNWAIECHRIVLYTHAPALCRLLRAGATEINVINIEFDVVARIVRFMYNGSLFCNITELPKFIEAAITFEMTDLLYALCNKVQGAVTPCNVIRWRKFANILPRKIPQIFDICDSMIKEQFSQVVQHQEFLDLPVDEMVNIFLLCKPAADSIGRDVLLKAAVSWMEEHPDDVDKCEQLWHCIQLDDCSKNTLLSAKEIDGTPEHLINEAIDKWDKSLQQSTIAFLYYGSFEIINEDGDLQVLKRYGEDLMCYYICPITNGFVVIVEDNEISYTQVECRLLKYTLPQLQETEVSAGHLKPPGIDCCSFHNNKLYLIPYENQMYIECFNFTDCSWSTFPNPKYPFVCEWKAASIGEDLYFINSEPHLLRFSDGEFTEISTEHISTVELSERLSFVHGERTFVIMAVRDSLYIFVTYSDSKSSSFTKIYVYKTHGDQSGWMSIAGTFECVPYHHIKPLWLKSDGSILIACMVHTNDAKQRFCKFDVNKGVMKRSKFPYYTGCFNQPLLIDRKVLENFPCREGDV